MDTISDISSESTSYTDISKIEVIANQTFTIINIIDIDDNIVEQLIPTTYNIVESAFTKNYDSPITLNRYQIDICNQDNDGNKYHLSFTTSRESGPIIDDNCFNTLTTYEYSNEFHSNADISINSTIDNSYCFSGLGTMPMSGIIIWSGSKLPDDGWVYCDGQNGTPDLRGRFIMGSTNDETININGENATYNIDQSGGFQRVTLQEEEMPAHSHSVGTSNATNHSHTIEATNETANTGNVQGGNHSHNLEDKVGSNYSGGEGQPFQVDYWQGDEARKGNYSRGVDSNNQSHSHSINIQHEHSINNCATYNHTHNMNEFGGSGSHENLPPYYVLSFIMRIR
jgi:microcystin-dependent protein